MKTGDRVHSIAIGRKAEFDGTLLRLTNAGWIVRADTGGEWLRSDSEIEPIQSPICLDCGVDTSFQDHADECSANR